MSSLSDNELAAAKVEAEKLPRTSQEPRGLKQNDSKNELGTAGDAAKKPPLKEVYKDSPAEKERKELGGKTRALTESEKKRRSLISEWEVMLLKRPRYSYDKDSKRYHRCGIIVGGSCFTPSVVMPRD